MTQRVSEWTKGVEQPDGGWVFPDAPMTPDVMTWEHRDVDGVKECRAVYSDAAPE